MSAGNSNLAGTKSLLLEIVAEAQELKTAAGGSVTDAVAGWLAPQYLMAAREKLSAGGAGRFEVLRTFLHDWAKLRHGDHTTERLAIEREKLDEARKTGQCKALEICLNESKRWPEVRELFRAAFAQLAEREKGTR
jgi:hypothetical protein